MGAQWRGFSDLGSGLRGFSWRAGTTPGGSDVMPERPLGLTFSAFTTDLPQLLPEGPTIFLTVSAMDAAGSCCFVCLPFNGEMLLHVVYAGGYKGTKCLKIEYTLRILTVQFSLGTGWVLFCCCLLTVLHRISTYVYSHTICNGSGGLL